MRYVFVLTLVIIVSSPPTAAIAQMRSLFIGIDGLGFGTQGFDVADTPIMDSLIAGTWVTGYHGAYSDQAFAGGEVGTETQQPTVSGPGWSTMLTAVWTDRHGVTGNGSSFANGEYTNNPPYLATLKEAIPTLTTASYVNWGPIDNYIISSIDFDGDPTNDVDFHAAFGNDALVVANATAAIADAGGLDPDAVFVSLDDVDWAGHSCGSSGGCYRAEIEDVDRQVGQLLASVVSRPSFPSENWQIVITADHGHRTTGGHGGHTEIERTIPFIVASKSLNQGPLPIFPQSVSHADVAPTILDHFDVPLPAHYWGVSRAQGSISIDPDINGDGIVSGDGTEPYAIDDVTAFIFHWLQPNTVADPNPADLNLDGIANIGDWAILNLELPEMAGAIAAALGGPNAPEPSSLVLACIIFVAFGSRRTRST